jgi:cephalosporin-C deacetylase-like acetyl esterase
MDRFQKCDPEFQIESETKKDNYTDLRFSFQSEEGYRIPCHLLLPDGIQNPPAMICLQGHTTGMHISLGQMIFEKDERFVKVKEADFAIRTVKEGFAAIAMEQRNFGEMGALEDGATGCFEPAMTALLMGRTVIGARVWDLMRLIDVLEQEFAEEIDLTALCCMGNSGGGTATAYFAALDDRIALAMPSCAICDFTESIGAMRHCACNYVPHMAEFFGMDDLIAMAYPKLYVQVSGIEDAGFWIKGARNAFQNGRKIYDQQGDANRIALVEGPEGHRFYPDLAWPIVHRLLSK